MQSQAMIDALIGTLLPEKKPRAEEGGFAERAARNIGSSGGGIGSTIGSTAGAVAGGIFGGAPGAAIGSAAGGQVGSALDNARGAPAGPAATINSGTVDTSRGDVVQDSALSVGQSLQALAIRGLTSRDGASGKGKKF